MKRKKLRRQKKIKLFLGFFTISICGLLLFLFVQDRPDEYQVVANTPKVRITLSDGRSTFIIPSTEAPTIGDLLNEVGIVLGDHDTLSRDLTEPVVSGDHIAISRGKKISFVSGQSEEEFYTHSYTVKEALQERGIELGTFDILTPALPSALAAQQDISLVRVRVEEEMRTKEIPFKTIAKEDDKMGWQEKKVTQKGIPGTKSITERVSYHDDKEVGREVIGEEITTEPTEEIVTQGTYVKVGKKHKGAASWYAHTGTLSAANPWMPIGSYAKVTNTANGKTVIVRINDRGPFVPGRIIDLDKVAWQKIASLGAGVINVRVEEVLN